MIVRPRMNAVMALAACVQLITLSVSCGGGATKPLSALLDSPSATLSPLSLSFGSQPLESPSSAQTVILANTGSGTLMISSITVNGDFTQTNNCGANLAVGKICTIGVIFSPTAKGTRTGTLSILDNSAGSPQTISLSGTGASSASSASPSSRAAVSFSPTSLTFGNQAVQTTSTAQSFTLTNSGDGALTISSIALTGANASDFAQTNNCGSSVASGAKCTISVTFKPTANGSRTAAVTVTDDATGSPQSVTLSGTGGSASAVASLSPSSLSFGNEPWDVISSSQVITLSNTGSASLSISKIAFTGANATDFTEADTCGTSVAAGGKCTIAILFTPSIIGACTASLSVTDNVSGSPQSVSLAGTGILDVILSWVASTTPGVTGYNVYRGTTSGGESSTPLNSTPISGTTDVDANVKAGVTYYYVLRTVGPSDTILSAASNETAVTIP